MKQPKLMIVGAGSRLGFRLMQKAAGRFDWIGVDRVASRPEIRAADITHPDEILPLFKTFQPDYVLQTAAITDVDGCEANQKLAWSVNVDGARNIADICQKFKARLIHVSTDYIFDGRDGPYDEDASPNPINYYGLTKWEAEKAVQSLCPESITVRTCVPYDWNPQCPPNFLMWLVGKLREKQGVSIVNDQWNTPTYNPHLAEVLLMLCDRWAPGVYNVSGRDFVNRYDFSLAVCDAFDFDRSLVTPTDSARFKQSAARPPRAGLKVGKIERHLGITMMSVKEGLEFARRDWLVY